ncbi:MAG: FMN-binding protein [Deltaproteobacteria bacterium]|nr:FMN-binding protein [Deltaproteobacteria bacterium]
MTKQKALVVVSAVAVFAASVVLGHAFTLLTLKEALLEVFGAGTKIIKQTERLKGEVEQRVTERLGGSLEFLQEGSESAAVVASKKIDFYFAEKDGKKIGVAVIDDQPGKWGPVEFMIAMDLRGAVQRVLVMSYQEKRGRPIARRSFMDQYQGKTSGSVLTVGKDITGIAGATISSRAATFAVKKAIVLYEEFYLHDKG